jgi:hypothetical protein
MGRSPCLPGRILLRIFVDLLVEVLIYSVKGWIICRNCCPAHLIRS